MGIFEQVFRPGNEARQKQVNDLITDIVSDLKYIANATNHIIDTFNKMLGSSVANVAYNSAAPKQLIEDVRDRYEEIEKLARAKYDNLDAIDKPALDALIKEWEGKMSPDDVDELMDQLKQKGFASEAASIAASIAVYMTVTPYLSIAFRAFTANVLGVVIGALAGLVAAAIVDAIAAEQNYTRLEEAIADLTKTKALLNAHREQVVNAADDLKLSVAISQRPTKKKSG